MRIVGGTLKGRRFQPPAKLKARPTTDMAREALFNVLANLKSLDGVSVLDLFCGTGAMALEFWSRGARPVIAADVDPRIKPFLSKLLRDWEVTDFRYVQADVFKMLKNPQRGFDIVFADPPYADPRYPEIPALILEGGWIAPDGIFILEHGDKKQFEGHPQRFLFKNYGSVNFSFFKKDAHKPDVIDKG